MATIPTGNFGFRQADPAQQTRIRMEGQDAVAVAMQRAGNTIANIGENMAQQKEQEDQAMFRIKASKAIAEHELAVATLDSDIEMKVRSGEIQFDQAEAARAEALQKLQLEDFSGAPPEIKAHVETARMQVAGLGGLRLKGVVQQAKVGKMQADISLLLDAQGKKAGLPGADVEGINASIDAMDADGRLAFGAEWDLKKQQFREGNYLNHVQQRLMEAGDNPSALKQLEHELAAKDGYYADKIDANKRLALQNNISNNISRIEQRNEMLAMKREMRAMSVVKDVEQQIASGLPPKPEDVNSWLSITKGTAAEGAVVGLMKQGEQVQNFLRSPIEAQKTIIQEMEANLTNNGGSPEDKAHLDRLKNVFEANQKQLQDTPLLYAKNRLGADVEPLDFSAAVTPGRENELFTALRDRVATVNAIREKNGAEVKPNILLPQEADMLKNQLANLPPQGQRQILEGLRKASGDDKAYNYMMDQIAPDKPVQAFAGKLASKQAETTVESGGWFGAPTKAGSRNVSETLLRGESILSAKDGEKFPMPEQKEFDAQFEQFLGGAFANAPGAYSTASQAVKAYYAARASEEGLVSKQVDAKLMREAVRATIGEPVEHNGKTVLAPWGMDSDTFTNKAETQYRQLGLSVDFDDVNLLPAGDGKYAIVSGRAPLLKNGQPVYIEVR